MTVYKMDSVDRDKSRETAYRLTSDVSASLMPPGVDNVVIVPTCCERSTSIDDDRVEATLGTTMYINGSIVMSRGQMCAMGSHALMSMISHAVMKRNVTNGATHRCSVGNSRGMK